MSMQFRYKLAKETFKGKKVPPKNDQIEEQFIDSDQRGNQSFAKQVRVKSETRGNKTKREDSLLSMGRESVTESETTTSREVSRRNLFSVFNPATYVEEAQNTPSNRKNIKKKKRKKNVERATAETEVSTDLVESENITGHVDKSHSPEPRPGVFRRLWNWLKSCFNKSPAGEIPATDISEASVSLEEPLVQVRMVQTEEELEAEKKDEGETDHFNNLKEEEPDPEDQEVSRRNLMRQGFHFFAKPAVENISEKIETVNRSIDKITKRKAMIRPPGAITEKNFLQACTRCDACIHACPKDAIKRAPKSLGFWSWERPILNLSKTRASCAMSFLVSPPVKTMR